MSIYDNTQRLDLFSLDHAPANLYVGSTKIAGWHAASYSGTSPLAVDCDYNVPPDALTVDGKCGQTPSCWGTNLITNGDFSNGTTGWTLAGGHWPQLDNNIGITIPSLKFDTNMQSSIAWRDIPCQTGHKIYFSSNNYLSAYTSGSGWVLRCWDYGSFTNTTDSAQLQTALLNEWQLRSAIKTVTNGGVRLEVGYQGQSIRTLYVDNIIVIDLTAAFGAGKEPTASQMDAIMTQFPNSWFNGSAQLSTDTTTYTANSPSPSYPAPISTLTGNMTITGADGASSDTATVALGSNVCANLPDGTHDTYDAVTGVLTKRVGKVVLTGAESGWYAGGTNTAGKYRFGLPFTSVLPAGGVSEVGNVSCSHFPAKSPVNTYVCIEGIAVDITARFFCYSNTVNDTLTNWKSWLVANPVTVYYKLATPTTVQLTPHLPVVRTGIKTLSIGADVVPTLSATVKSMD